MEVMEDFCFDQSNQFKRRLKVYEKELAQSADRDGEASRSEGILRGFEGCEGKTKRLIGLFNDLLMNRTKDEFVPKSTD